MRINATHNPPLLKMVLNCVDTTSKYRLQYFVFHVSSLPLFFKVNKTFQFIPAFLVFTSIVSNFNFKVNRHFIVPQFINLQLPHGFRARHYFSLKVMIPVPVPTRRTYRTHKRSILIKLARLSSSQDSQRRFQLFLLNPIQSFQISTFIHISIKSISRQKTSEHKSAENNY